MSEKIESNEATDEQVKLFKEMIEFPMPPITFTNAQFAAVLTCIDNDLTMEALKVGLNVDNIDDPKRLFYLDNLAGAYFKMEEIHKNVKQEVENGKK